MISVCMPTFNGEKYILPQIESIISQLNEDDELIVSDDGSTDNTLSVVRALNDPRIKILRSQHQKNLISNVENALQNAVGDVIFLADQDDVWLPDKVEVSLNYLKHSDLIISDCIVTDENLDTINESFYSQNNSQFGKYKALIRNSYLGCCMAFHRKVLDDVLPFPKQIPMHDIWIGNVAAFRHKVRFIDEKLILYRRHGQNSSTTSEPTKASFFLQIKYRLDVIIPLVLKLAEVKR